MRKRKKKTKKDRGILFETPFTRKRDMQAKLRKKSSGKFSFYNK